ncbi:MAG: hypothetical protein JSS51_12275 [Planctomycetes bacterium]|nr:hypothetical protein [Planctomycetota bacterium]
MAGSSQSKPASGRPWAPLSGPFQALRIRAWHAIGTPVEWLCRFRLGPQNPAFPDDPATVGAAVDRLRSDPQPLPRPLIVFSGYRVPGLFGGHLAANLASLTCGTLRDVRLFAYPQAGDIEPLVNHLARRIGQQVGLDASGDCTQPVDVVGISMGGIVGRLAAARARTRPPGVPRVDIRRLFTIATPHRGARLALRIHVDKAACDMQPNAPFLARLDTCLPMDDYELIPYATINDITVGSANCSPWGTDPIWIRGTRRFAHTTISMHRGIMADIALRLRRQTPLGQPSPVPESYK